MPALLIKAAAAILFTTTASAVTYLLSGMNRAVTLIVAALSAVMSFVVWIRPALESRKLWIEGFKLEREIRKLDREEKREQSRIVQPSAVEVKHYGRQYRTLNRDLLAGYEKEPPERLSTKPFVESAGEDDSVG